MCQHKKFDLSNIVRFENHIKVLDSCLWFAGKYKAAACLTVFSKDYRKQFRKV